MKKILTIVAVASLAMVSCKKNYTCECTATGSGTSIVSNITIKDTKKKATDACEAMSTSVSGGGSTVSQTCKIK